MNYNNKILSDALSDNQLTLSGSTQQKLIQYLELIQSWNKVFNLTTITEPRDMVYLHLIDSLAVSPYLHGLNLLDVGSGAGLPGIPLAIIHPEQHWMLMDKNSKKTRFLTQTIAELKLTNANAIHSRCEDFQPATKFDSILSRAFGTLRMFVETTAHMLNKDGIFIAMKGKYPEDELQDLPDNVEVKNIQRLDIKGISVERHIICLQQN